MRRNVFILAKPGYSAQDARIDEAVVHSDYSYPKADITRRPEHIGIVDINWATSGIVVPFLEIRTLFSKPHGYTGIPTVVAAYQIERLTERSAGMMGIQMGALGFLGVDADEKNVNVKYISFDVTSATAITPFRIFIRYYIFAERGKIVDR